MRCTEKQDAERRHVDGAQVFRLLTGQASAVDQGALDDQATQRVADEDDRALGAVSQLWRKRCQFWERKSRPGSKPRTFRLAARLDASVSAWLTIESRDAPSVKAATLAL